MCVESNEECTALNTALDTVDRITGEVSNDNIYQQQETDIQGAESEVHRVVYEEGDEWKTALDVSILNATVVVRFS